MPTDNRNQRSILFVDPFFGTLGGGVMVSCWIAEALADHHNVTWLSWRGLDLAKLNRFAGTDLSHNRIAEASAPVWLRTMGEAINRIDPDDYSIQRWSLLMRYARHLSKRYDMTISCNDEMDMGAPGIQYIHYPYLNQFFERSEQQPLRLKPKHRWRPWVHTSGFDPARFAANLTLANSDWTGEVVAQSYGITPHTLYPPVPGEFAGLPWEERDNAAICVGRLGQDKRLETIVEIVERARMHTPDLRLRIVGVPYDGPGGVEGLAFAKWAAEAHDWIDLHIDLPRPELVQLMCRSRIGIHAKLDEHFGISVAEMVRAGAAVFVHDSGGQVEIVNRDPRLTYVDASDAAAKLTAVLGDADVRRDVLDRLHQHSQTLTTDHFAAEIRRHLDRALSEKANRP